MINEYLYHSLFQLNHNVIHYNNSIKNIKQTALFKEIMTDYKPYEVSDTLAVSTSRRLTNGLFTILLPQN